MKKTLVRWFGLVALMGGGCGSSGSTAACTEGTGTTKTCLEYSLSGGDSSDALGQINAEMGTTIVVVTHDPDVAARMPRTVTIRDGRVGGEGRAGQEFAVVAADGSLPLPPQAIGAFPPGALVRVHVAEGVWTIHREDGQVE